MTQRPSFPISKVTPWFLRKLASKDRDQPSIKASKSMASKKNHRPSDEAMEKTYHKWNKFHNLGMIKTPIIIDLDQPTIHYNKSIIK